MLLQCFGGGVVFLIRVKCVVFMIILRDVRVYGISDCFLFVEFDMNVDGFGCMFLFVIVLQVSVGKFYFEFLDFFQ